MRITLNTAFRNMGVGLLAVALSPACAPLLHADEWNKMTKVTFTEAVQIPGTVLPPGTYVFRLLDSSSNRNIVQVFNEDGRKLITTVLAAPNYRMDATGKTVLRFDERPVGTPEALKAWFYPGDNFGQEFIYKKGEGLQTASVTPAPAPLVETAQNATPTEETQPVTSDQPAPVTTDEPTVAAPPPSDENNPNDVTEPEQDPITPAPAATTPAETKPATTDSDKDKLPKTASEMPLIGLLSLVCLGSGLAIRNYRRRMV